MSKVRRLSFHSKFSAVYEVNGDGGSGKISRCAQSELCEKTDTAATTYSSCSKDVQVIGERIAKHESQILESLKNSECMVEHSMETGAATAKELHHQREQLERTNCCLNEIDDDLRTSKRHIRSVSSFFGGMKNYVSGKASKVTYKFNRKSREIPSEVQRKDDDDDDDGIDKIEVSEDSGVECVSYRSRSFDEVDNFNDAVNCHLNKINNGLEALKGLAVGLGDELDSQNKLLDELNTKTEKAAMEMDRQAKIVDKLLK
ncbi:synaptosomal-associated protein 29-like [Planococcus citri]|uniref:synaptosomal-associated protein 29-like n=1 Tax=Planococcus citri TaxID=170843 RepID=UPI0031F819A7